MLVNKESMYLILNTYLQEKVIMKLVFSLYVCEEKKQEFKCDLSKAMGPWVTLHR